MAFDARVRQPPKLGRMGAAIAQAQFRTIRVCRRRGRRRPAGGLASPGLRLVARHSRRHRGRRRPLFRTRTPHSRGDRVRRRRHDVAGGPRPRGAGRASAADRSLDGGGRRAHHRPRRRVDRFAAGGSRRPHPADRRQAPGLPRPHGPMAPLRTLDWHQSIERSTRNSAAEPRMGSNHARGPDPASNRIHLFPGGLAPLHFLVAGSEARSS